jgi:hypothetical protein
MDPRQSCDWRCPASPELFPTNVLTVGLSHAGKEAFISRSLDLAWPWPSQRLLVIDEGFQKTASLHWHLVTEGLEGVKHIELDTCHTAHG